MLSQLGPYEIKEPIGRGGIATVYKAYHPATQRDVAIKILSQDIADDTSFKLRFEREARIVAGLQHIHILPVFDYGQQDETAYLVMPLITGGTLSRKLLSGKLESKEAARLFRQLASALDFAHQHGILHRDIKPGNILLDPSGNALLADFGLTRMIGDDKNITRSSIVGTPAYMSPEQGQGLDLDARSDLYSLGVVLFEMLTGDVPFEAETPVALIFKHVADPLPDVRLTHPEFPPALVAMLEKALAKLPSNRYPSAITMADALDAALAGKSIPANFDTDQLEAPTRIVETQDISLHDGETKILPSGVLKKRRRYSIAAAVAVILLVAAGLFLFLDDESSAEQGDSEPAYVLEIPAHQEQAVLKLAISPDGTRLISGGEDNVARVWDLTTGQQLYELEGHTADVYAVGYSGTRLFTGSEGGYFLWDAANGEMQVTGLEGGRVRNGVFAPSGENLVYTANNFIALSQQSSGFTGAWYNPNPTEGSYTNVAFTPNETQVIAGDDTGAVQIWNVAEGEIETTLEGHEAPVLAVAASQNLIASADESGKIILWDGETPRLLEEGEGAVNSLAFSPDGMQLIAAGADGMIRFWSMETGMVMKTLEHGSPVNSIIFTVDGKKLISGGADGRLLVWEL